VNARHGTAFTRVTGHKEGAQPQMDTDTDKGGWQVRCCRAATCRKAPYCAAGRPHAPDLLLDCLGRCYDHMPYVEGGVETWGTSCGGEYPPHEPGHGAGRVTTGDGA